MRKGRPPEHGAEVVEVLWRIWKVSEQPCGKRFVITVTVLSHLMGHWIGKVTVASLAMLPLFMLGALTSRVTQMRPGQCSWIWFVLGIMCYCLPPLLAQHGIGRLQLFYTAGLGSAFIIFAAVRQPRLSSLLSVWWLTVPGQWSYGIYLLHYPLLLAGARMVFAMQISVWIVWPVVITLPCEVSCCYIIGSSCLPSLAPDDCSWRSVCDKSLIVIDGFPSP